MVRTWRRRLSLRLVAEARRFVVVGAALLSSPLLLPETQASTLLHPCHVSPRAQPRHLSGWATGVTAAERVAE